MNPDHLETLRVVYNNLREEIVKRVEIEHQIIYFTLLTFGAVLAVGLKAENIIIFLLYPVLVMFLAVAWNDNQMRIGEIAAFIKENITPKLGGENVIGWELAQKRFYTKRYGFRHFILTGLGKRALFFGIQAIVIALVYPKLNDALLIYLVIAVASTVFTFGVLAFIRPPEKMP